MGLLDQVQGQGGGTGAPSFKFDKIGDGLIGPIVSAALADQILFNSNPPQKVMGDDGHPKKQVNVVIQTALRNWQGVSSIPTDENGKEKPPSEDTGLRAIYLKNQMAWAVTDAVKATGLDDLRVGDILGVKFSSELNVNKGNPAKQYEARYEKKADGVDLGAFASPAAATPPQAPPAAPAAPPQAPPPPPQPVWDGTQWTFPQAAPPAPAQAAPTQAAPPQQDPWATPPTGQAPPPF